MIRVVRGAYYVLTFLRCAAHIARRNIQGIIVFSIILTTDNIILNFKYFQFCKAFIHKICKLVPNCSKGTLMYIWVTGAAHPQPHYIIKLCLSARSWINYLKIWSSSRFPSNSMSWLVTCVLSWHMTALMGTGCEKLLSLTVLGHRIRSLFSS